MTCANTNKTIFIAAVILILVLTCLPLYAGSSNEHPGKNNKQTSRASQAGQMPVYVEMPSPGNSVPISNGRYLIYGFSSQPKIGVLIMKVRVYDSAGRKDASLVLTAESGMPSMPSMGTTLDTFKLSKKGDYLVPINISMLGDWEIKLTILKDGKVIYRGSHKFDV